ncbi:MAG: DNA-binding response regulator [Deltaproteobacteria bacterium RBG_16_71_12]|nr:MAG: DNA-binding response regulator [Deltaproteobacteria bacterium RBG_16_71_12]
MAAHILIVDDEADLATTLAYNLDSQGFTTAVAATGGAALALARERRPDLVLLDVMLPDISGLEVCRRLRHDAELRGVPVLMLTARGEEIDRVLGFEVGADDYLVKPFSVRELLLRVQAILRRSGAAAAPAPDDSAAIRFGTLTFDAVAHRVTVEGAEVALTALEFRLLSVLLERRGRVQTRERLLDDVWGITADITTRTVDTHVKRLREKLGAAADYVETLRGVGYRFRANPAQAGG